MDRAQREQQLTILLRISETIDVVGDVSATVENPSEMIAWAHILTEPKVFAWRSHVSGNRFVHLTAMHVEAPIHGRITVALAADNHRDFWNTLVGHDLEYGDERQLTSQQLVRAWATSPVESSILEVG